MNRRIRRLYQKYNNTAIILILIIVVVFWTYMKDLFTQNLLNIFGYSISLGLVILTGIGIYLYWPTIERWFR